MRMRRLVQCLVCVLAVLLPATAQDAEGSAGSPLDHPSAQALLEVFELLRDGYLHEVDETALWQGAIRGMIDVLGDPLTAYLDSSEAAYWAELWSATTGDGPFGGIGVGLAPVDPVRLTGARVTRLFSGSPATAAGVRHGDVLLEVDGADVRDLVVDEIPLLLRGEPGSAVQVIVLRPGIVEPLILEITRGLIDPQPVASQELPDGVGYIAIDYLGGDIPPEQFAEHLARLTQSGSVTSLILDLRNSHGGWFSQAVPIASEFLRGSIIMHLSSRDQAAVTSRAITPRTSTLPLVVLVNGSTRAATEVIAGALQGSERAVIVGERTFGLGTWPFYGTGLSDGGQLDYVDIEVLLPNRDRLAGRGVVPDIIVPGTSLPGMVVATGTGLQAGQVVELVVDGEVVARTVSTEAGFRLLGAAEVIMEHHNLVFGEVDLGSDEALRVAFETARELAAGARE